MLCSIVTCFLFKKINRKFIAFGNGSGLQISEKNILANDIAIFDRSKIKLTNDYFDVVPVVAIQIDIRADLTDEDSLSETAYILQKSKKMIEFGTQQVICVLIDPKKIIIVDASPKWKIVNFNADVPILDDIVLNLQELMEEEELEF